MKLQFRVLYRQFLFRMADLEALSAHAQGDANKLLGQFAALLIFVSMVLAIVALGFADSWVPALQLLPLTLISEHFLIATTMLVVGLFAVLCWDSTFPDRRDVLVLAPLPVRARTLFLAKIAAVATALGLTVGLLHVLAGLAWPFAFARQASPLTLPALTFDRGTSPMAAGDLKAVMDRDLKQALTTGEIPRGAGLVIGVVRHGERSIVAYGVAQPDSIFEIGSISKTFTGLLLAQMTTEGKVRLDQPLRDLLPPDTVDKPRGPEITLLDLATHHSGLPRAPSVQAADPRFPSRASDLFRTLKRFGVARPERAIFDYSNFGVALLGQALAGRAAVEFPRLLEDRITGPLGLRDTAVSLSAPQDARSLQGYAHGAPAPASEPNGFGPAGGIRSTAGDLLTYLEAQLHPERVPGLTAALRMSQELREKALPGTRIGLAWMYSPETRAYVHGGATPGFTSEALFCPSDDYAAVVLINQWAGADVLAEHVRQRLAGEPAISLETVNVPASRSFLRWFAAYWTTMIAAAAFLFCCVLGVQGVAAQLLPRRVFLRVSGALQMAAFCLFVSVYFLQPPFPQVDALLTSEGRRQLALFPSYWFLGVFHQLNGSMHPALAPLARRAWTALAIAVGVTASAYLLAYVRTLRQIVEEPDIVPGVRGAGWSPRFGGPLPTAVGQFSVRTLLRSRQHRVILAFYLGIAFALMVWFLKSPSVQKELAERDPWRQVNAPMLAASIIAMGFWIVGTRVVFALPLDLRANWVFRAAPVAAGPAILAARRRTMFALSVLPAWIAAAAVFLWLWPWRPALIHLGALALFGMAAAEVCLRGPQKIPFTCSYLPGKSNMNVAFWLYVLVVFQAINGATKWEISAFDDDRKLAKMFLTLAMAAAVLRWRSSSEAESNVAELRYEEQPDSAIQQLRLEAHAGGPAGI
jgi:CubicO group peptidase (beta-lactamase class C family)